ncbi:MAG: hypothetical protein ACC726_06535 [Chloroflexota bacterium]
MSIKRTVSVVAATALAASAMSLGTAVFAATDHEASAVHESISESLVSDARLQADALDGLVFGTIEAPRVIEITMTDTLRFDSDAIAIRTGETILFQLENPSAAPHSFLIGDGEVQAGHHIEMNETGGHEDDETEAPGHDDAVEGEEAAEFEEGGLPGPVWLEPGESGEILATFTEAGPLLIGCHVPGHWEAGMRAVISVMDAV